MDSDQDNVSGAPQSENSGLPPVGKPVWVQCEGFRTMAYRDKDGKWRSLGDHKELQGTVKVVESD